MSTEKILTIIVPSYNMEKYLPKCLGSLVVAPELMERLEVLVVNDGSKDRTSEIAHEFAAKWPQTFKVIDKKNGNYGSCINAALPVATGKYVKVLDADDSFDTDNLCKFLEFLIKLGESVDLVVSDFVEVNECGEILSVQSFDYPKRMVGDIDVFLKCDFRKVFMHAIAYCTELLRTINYHQTEGLSYTDNEWDTIPFVSVKRVAYFNAVVYRYTLGRIGQTVSPELTLRNMWMTAQLIPTMLAAIGDVDVRDESKAHRHSIEHIKWLTLKIYFYAIIKRAILPKMCIYSFDKVLSCFPNFYAEIGREVYSKFLRIQYIDKWREKSFLMPLYRYICLTYTKIRMGAV